MLPPGWRFFSSPAFPETRVFFLALSGIFFCLLEIVPLTFNVKAINQKQLLGGFLRTHLYRSHFYNKAVDWRSRHNAGQDIFRRLLRTRHCSKIFICFNPVYRLVFTIWEKYFTATAARFSAFVWLFCEHVMN